MTHPSEHDQFFEISYEDGAYVETRMGPGIRPNRYGIADSIKNIRQNNSRRSPLPKERAEWGQYLETVIEPKLYACTFTPDHGQRSTRVLAICSGITHGWFWQQSMLENRYSYKTL